MSPASRIACAESSWEGAAEARVGAGFTAAILALALGLPLAAGRRMALVAGLGDDINLVSLFDHLVLPQLHPAVGDAFAGLHVIFHPVPGADEVHLGLREEEPLRGLVGTQPLFDLGNGEPFAGRA